jgi:hypothetical protein
VIAVNLHVCGYTNDGKQANKYVEQPHVFFAQPMRGLAGYVRPFSFDNPKIRDRCGWILSFSIWPAIPKKRKCGKQAPSLLCRDAALDQCRLIYACLSTSLQDIFLNKEVGAELFFARPQKQPSNEPGPRKEPGWSVKEVFSTLTSVRWVV